MALFSGTGSRMASAVPSNGEVASWLHWVARFGYAARGVVYLVVGGIALQAAISSVRSPEDSSGALLLILRQPFGRALLAITAGGLVGWVLWRLFQAIRDPERLGTSAKGVAKRIGYVISALLYGGLAVEAIRLLRGAASGGQGGEAAADHWTAVVMSQPAGRWIVAAVGGVVLLFGAYEMYRAYKADFHRLDLTSLGADGRRRVILFGRLGMAARGIVFGIIGWFLLRAARRYDPQQAQGFETALQTIQDQGYGQYLLGAVGVGLLCFGLFELAEARYRVIRPL